MTNNLIKKIKHLTNSKVVFNMKWLLTGLFGHYSPNLPPNRTLFMSATNIYDNKKDGSSTRVKVQ